VISVQIGEFKFQFRVAAIAVVAGHVLLHRLEGGDFWALPGGRVEPGEDARAALLREMEEELGETVTCGKLAYLVESFFDGEDARYHEIGMYFPVQLSSASALGTVSQVHWGVEGSKRLEFRWFPVAELSSVPLYPEFLREALARELGQTQHVVQRG